MQIRSCHFSWPRTPSGFPGPPMAGDPLLLQPLPLASVCSHMGHFLEHTPHLFWAPHPCCLPGSALSAPPSCWPFPSQTTPRPSRGGHPCHSLFHDPVYFLSLIWFLWRLLYCLSPLLEGGPSRPRPRLGHSCQARGGCAHGRPAEPVACDCPTSSSTTAVLEAAVGLGRGRPRPIGVPAPTRPRARTPGSLSGTGSGPPTSRRGRGPHPRLFSFLSQDVGDRDSDNIGGKIKSLRKEPVESFNHREERNPGQHKKLL